ncbi:4-coumarate--CoA ligase family protein [Sulfitobacter sp. JL08]|uniref:AMP-binding protein n=1 Tax=Sulfitobacter sp. JL08 TaxID=2070369 RepID=UPI000E0A06DA|nr:AMP-binding protein [Sulfitobacter sp. JL08]AXI55916.1 4-coumarate--CoA ligase family protein [Sulfitobacter sp. JL08]
MTIYKSPMADLPLVDRTITQRVFEGLETRPDAIVIIDGVSGEQVRAGQLISDIQSLAGGLTERGFGKGHTIAIMAPNMPAYAVVFHAVAWAGGTITTINPTYTANEARHQLIDSNSEMLLTIPAFLDIAKAAVDGTGVKEIVVIGTSESATPLDDLMGPPLIEQVPVDVNDHVVVLPYSSGTTGLPKGVMLTHRNLVVNLDQVLAVADMKEGDTTPAFLPFFHIYGMMVLLNSYLAAGACIITMPRFDLELFLRLTQDHKARALWVVPPVAIALAKHPMIDQFDLSSVEYVGSAAAPLGADLANAVANRLNCIAVQAYGMTELSPGSHVMSPHNPKEGACGQTLPNTECRIVDLESGQNLGPNQEGELWVRGPQVMKGYLNNPDATAQTIDKDGWLRTGDIACFDNEGFLFIRDRLKELIKYKGFQVAPAELEATLMAHDAIADAAVIGIPDDEAGEVPMAFVVLTSGQSLNEDEVKAHVAEHLSHYKQVRHVSFIDAIPKSASGKILRRVLRDGLAA